MRLAVLIPAGLFAASFGWGAEYIVDTFAGAPGGDPTTAAGLPLKTANGIALEPTGALIVVDTGGNRVWRATPGGRVELVAGTGVPGDGGDGGPAVEAQLNSPRDVAFGPNGSLFISDAGNRRIRVIAAGGTIDTLAMEPVDYGPDVKNPEELRNPSAIAYDGEQRRLYICETGLLRFIDERGALTCWRGRVR